MRKTIKALLIITCLASIIAILNIEVIYNEGIDYKVYERKIPLWVKMIAFIERDYQYKKLTLNIIKDSNDDIEKLKSIFDWTCENIYSGIPPSFHIKDNHILNIIIRGYGTQDQSADVFSTLSTYAGFPAAMYAVSPQGRKESMMVSVVNFNGRFLIFDTYNKNYFINRNDEIASIKDIIKNPSILKTAKNKPIIRGIPYEEYFNTLKPIEKFDKTLRTELQMPVKRLWYELRLKLGLIRQPEFFYYGEERVL